MLTDREKLLLLHWYYFLPENKEKLRDTIQSFRFPHPALKLRPERRIPLSSPAAIRTVQKYRDNAITLFDENYPDALYALEYPPPVLYVLGNARWDTLQLIAIVGTRKPSVEGKADCIEITQQLCQRGFDIVSGLAVGIDALAHATCLNAKQRTIAVLGCGWENVYPKSNKGLLDRIIRENGSIVSEYPPDLDARKEFFPKRNRIIAALAAGTLVIEGGQKSGAAITGKLALAAGKTCLVLTRSWRTEYGQGAIRLIENGALAFTGIQEALEAVSFPYGGKLRPQRKSAILLPGKRQFTLNEFCEINQLDETKAIPFIQELLCNEKILSLRPNFFQCNRF